MNGTQSEILSLEWSSHLRPQLGTPKLWTEMVNDRPIRIRSMKHTGGE